jgi:hypothetical protein
LGLAGENCNQTSQRDCQKKHFHKTTPASDLTGKAQACLFVKAA